MKRKIGRKLGVLLLLLAWGCSESKEPASIQEQANPGEAKREAEAPATPETPKVADAPATEKAETPSPPAEGPTLEETSLRQYFAHLSAGELLKAQGMTLRTLEECLLFFKEKSLCETMMVSQLNTQKMLTEDPVPYNSVLLEFISGQKRVLGTEHGFHPDTSLWVGGSLRARGPAGNEFIMRSLGVLVRGVHSKVIWGKRRSFGDTRRTPVAPGEAVDAPPKEKAPASKPARSKGAATQ